MIKLVVLVVIVKFVLANLSSMKFLSPALLVLLCLFCNIQTALAQESNISKDSLLILVEKTYTQQHDFDYKGAIATSAIIEKEALKTNNYIFAAKGNLRLGSVYLSMRDSSNSLSHYRKALNYAILSKKDSLIRGVYNDIGNAYMETGGDLQKARENFEKAIEISKKAGEEDKDRLASILNVAWVYINLEKPSEALPYLNTCRRIIESNTERHPLYSINLDILRGRYHMLRNRGSHAIFLLKGAAQRANDGDFIQQELEAQSFLSEGYQKNGNLAEAIESLKVEKKLESKYNTIIREQQFQEASAKLKLAQYEIDLNKAKVEQTISHEKATTSRLLSNIFIVASIILLAAFIAAFLLYRGRRKIVKKLNENNDQLIKAKEEAERLSKLKTQFFSTVSHELRTPLYGVIGLSTILLEDENLGGHKDDLKSLKFSADYLLALINDVLTLNKVDANGMKLERAPFNLKKLVNNITNSFAFSLEQNNNKIQVSIDETLPTNLIGDSIKLSQILMNLVGNAVKFNENGTIEIVIKSLGKNRKGLYETQFFIKDNGIGIPLEKQESIFEEFSQIESNNYNYQGTGLGLPIVRKLLDIYDSKIDLKSSPGNGAIFSFVISLEENVKNINEFSVINEVISPTESVFENMHILIVDDNKINQKVTQRILETRHFKTTLADDGLQAIEQVQKNKFNLVLMDIHMPKMGGIEATERIRSYNKTLPIIALTAVEIEEARANIINAGMNDIILKPYDVAQFLTTILRHLSVTQEV